MFHAGFYVLMRAAIKYPARPAGDSGIVRGIGRNMRMIHIKRHLAGSRGRGPKGRQKARRGWDRETDGRRLAEKKRLVHTERGYPGTGGGRGAGIDKEADGESLRPRS